MIKNERLKQITDIISTTGAKDVKSLARMFGVTPMTIRRDLEELNRRQIIVRTRGGAISRPDNILSENAYELRIVSHIQEKNAIAQSALALIQDGDKVFFDSSTTVFCITKILRNDQEFLIVTDTLTTALEANSRKNIKVICLGGELKKSTNSCVSLLAEQAIETMNFSTSFLSAPVVTLDGKVSLSSISELSIKKKVMHHSRKNVLLFDSSKLHASSDFLTFANISDFDTVITDSGIDQAFLNRCRESGVPIVVADDKKNTKI